MIGRRTRLVKKWRLPTPCGEMSREMCEAIELLLPPPREAVSEGGGFALSERPTISLPPLVPEAVAQPLQRALAELDLAAETSVARGRAEIRFELEEGAPKAQAYRLDIDDLGIRIHSSDPAGLFYGASTLAQWLRIHFDGVSVTRRQHDRRMVPALRASDWPDFLHRGVLLDISRDKVPTLDTLRELVDLLASWKINQLQLYMEHTFAYRGHESVWREASALTAAEIRDLDAYCRARFIELVPNQNSFGHFHRWLVHVPYRRLAESPEGIEHPFSVEREPYSLCPIDPGSGRLLGELYDQLLPCFSSKMFNVGLDETFDLGFGRSAEVCDERGKGRVYLEFLQQIEGMVSERGRRMQFWGDVILNHPELLGELPRRAIALEWGYEADHPFATDAGLFSGSGLDFYVCPGTSSWNSFAGRTRNAILNLASAAIHGKAQGALGYLVTDWGDNGHLQPLPVSFPGFVAGAAFGWNASAARAPHELPVAKLLDQHVFGDRAGVTGAAICGLGDTYLETGADSANGSALFFAVLFAHKPSLERRGRGLSASRLERVLEHVDRFAAPLASARLARGDAGVIGSELQWVAEMLRFAARLALERLERGEDEPLSTLAVSTRSRLAGQLDELIELHREIWLARNRPGGLDSSSARLRRVRELLET